MATITKVTYRRTYNLGSFQSEAIGVEMDLNENEDPINAFREMNKITDAYHAETLTQLDLYRGTQIRDIEEQDVQIEKIPDTIKSTMEEIDKCLTMDELKGFWLVCKGNLSLSTYYKIREKQLNDVK